MQYRAKTNLYIVAKSKMVEPGEIVDLSHLKEEEIKKLLEAGYIEEVSQEKKKKGGEE